MWTRGTGIPLKAIICIYTTIWWETGGFALKWWNAPNDKGGPTMWGIASASAPKGIRSKIIDGKLLLGEAVDDAYQRYYLPCQHIAGPAWDKMDHRLVYVIFDAYFHSPAGSTVMIKRLQQSVGAKTDGVCGPMTAAALAALSKNEVTKVLLDLRATAALQGAELAANTRRNGGGEWTANFVKRAEYRVDSAMAMPIPA